jgi:2-haloacid dehalogenase
MQPGDISAIVFDTFGTMVDWRGSLIVELAQFGKARGIDIDWVAFADAWRAGYQPAMEPIRKGERGFTKLDVLHREILDRLIARFNITGLSEAELAHMNKAWHRLNPWPDVVPGLTRLKKRYIIGPLSNGNTALLLNMAKRAGMPWDTVLGSDTFRAYKPTKEAYLGLCALLDLPPDRVMLGAAHNNDLAAAQACGLRTGFIKRPREFGLRPNPGATPTGNWDIVADDVEDLAAQLGL